VSKIDILEVIDKYLNESRKIKYHQIETKELVKFVGGKDFLKRKFDDSDDAYSYLMKKQNDLINVWMKKGYNEVGEVNNTDVGDFCDNILPAKG
jgi:hypothetical protein